MTESRETQPDRTYNDAREQTEADISRTIRNKVVSDIPAKGASAVARGLIRRLVAMAHLEDYRPPEERPGSSRPQSKQKKSLNG